MPNVPEIRGTNPVDGSSLNKSNVQNASYYNTSGQLSKDTLEIKEPPPLTSFEIASKRIPDEKLNEYNKIGKIPKDLWIYFNKNTGEYNLRWNSWYNSFFGGGTHKIPTGYEVKNNKLGNTEVIEKDRNSLWMSSDNANKAKIDALPKLDTTEFVTHRIAPEKVEKYNEVGYLPPGLKTAFSRTTGEYELKWDSAVTDGSYKIPAGFELRENQLGQMVVIEADRQNIWYKGDKNLEKPPEEKLPELSSWEITSKIVSKDKLDAYNKAGRMPDNALITWNNEAGEYQVAWKDPIAGGLMDGTPIIPKGFELRQSRVLGQIQVVLEDEESMWLRSK